MFSFYIKLLSYYLFRTKYPQKWERSEFFPHDDNKKKLIFTCDGFLLHGGLADRLRGIITGYYYAKKLKIPYYINWIHPFSLENFLVPNKYDWRICSDNISYNYKTHFPVVVLDSHGSYNKKIKKLFFNYLLKDRRTLILYTNTVYDNIDYKKLYDELFKLSPKLKENINFHINFIGNKFWSFTFRFGNTFGDFKDEVGDSLNERNKQEIISRYIKELLSLLNRLPDGFKALITSDSQYFLKKISKLSSKIYLIDRKLYHFDHYEKNEAPSIEDWMQSFIDFNLIMNAEKVFLIRQKESFSSGFAQFAAYLSGKPYYDHTF